VATERRKSSTRRTTENSSASTVADRIDPLIAASSSLEVATPRVAPASKPRPRKPAPRDKPVPRDKLDVKLDDKFDVKLDVKLDDKPYVLPKIIPAEVDPEPEEAPAEIPEGLIVAPASVAVGQVAPQSAFKPKFVRAAKTLARALQPVIVPRPRPRVRRVTRVVRHIDTWSVFKIALLFNIFIYAVCLMAGVMLWRVALNTGTIENVERFFESFGWQTFELKGGEIYHNAWIAGLFAVVGLTGLAVLAATMFNLITDLVGGVRLTVLEEEVVAREPRTTTWPRLQRPREQSND